MQLMREPLPRIKPLTLAQAMERARRLPRRAALMEVMLVTASLTRLETAALMDH